MITDIFSKLTTGVNLKVYDCEEALVDENNSLIGHFPILIYKHYLIPR